MHYPTLQYSKMCIGHPLDGPGVYIYIYIYGTPPKKDPVSLIFTITIAYFGHIFVLSNNKRFCGYTLNPDSFEHLGNYGNLTFHNLNKFQDH